MQNLTTVRKVTSLNEQHIRLANNKTNMGVKIGKMGKKKQKKIHRGRYEGRREG